MSTPSAAAADEVPEVERSDRFPQGIPYIVGNEGAERFSFYGMRAILYVYLTSLFLHFAEERALPAAQVAAAKAHATEVVHLFMAGVYAFPMIGAILADRYLGKYRVIFWVSMLYVLGHGTLAVAGRLGAMGSFSSAEMGMYIGLGLIALGAGGIKPCVSANVGDQFTRANAHLVGRVYQIFYFIINFGSFFATLLIPYLKDAYGAEVAFAVPGVLMAIAAVVFWGGRNRFTRIPPTPGGRLGLLDVVIAVLLFIPFAAFAFFDLVPRIAEHLTGGHFAGVGSFLRFLAKLAWKHTLVAAVSLGLGAYLFRLRRRIQEEPESELARSFGVYRTASEEKPAEPPSFLTVLVYAFGHRSERAVGEGFFGPARRHFGDEGVEGPIAVLRIMVVFSMVSVFWALFDQHSSTWIEQARQMDLTVHFPSALWSWTKVGAPLISVAGGAWLLLWVSNVKVPRPVVVGGLALAGLSLVGAIVSQLSSPGTTTLTLKASQISALNPIMVMGIIPALNGLVWQPLEKRGIVVKPLQKMTAGMFATAVSFVIAALLQVKVQSAPGTLSVMWQVPQYLVITTAEVLVSTTGLEFAYTQAPKTMKSTIMGFWLLCVTIGNLLVAFLSPLERVFPLSVFFWVFAGLMGAAAMVFAVLASRYRGKTQLQG